MVSLIDIANSKTTVPLRGQDVEVTGLTADHIGTILSVFPEVRRLLTGNTDAEIITSLISRMPEAVALMIAAGTCGDPLNDKFIAVARGLAIGEQFTVLEAIVKQTFPQTLKSFLDGVAALVNQSGARGWAPAMTSPEPSNVASPRDDQKQTAGEAPQSS